MCRSRRELSNAYLLAKIGVDTAENEPLEVWGKHSIQYSLHSLGLPPFAVRGDTTGEDVVRRACLELRITPGKEAKLFEWMQTEALETAESLTTITTSWPDGFPQRIKLKILELVYPLM